MCLQDLKRKRIYEIVYSCLSAWKDNSHYTKSKLFAIEYYSIMLKPDSSTV